MFGAIKNNWHKSEAAVVVQNLLKLSFDVGFHEFDPAKVANILVGRVWDTMPDVFAGKFGSRPHKISIAAAALANAAESKDIDQDLRRSIILALVNIMSELEKNGKYYPFTQVDITLIENAERVASAAMAEFERIMTKL